MMADIITLASLWVSAFLAATILPMQSEAVLVGLLLTKSYAPLTLLMVATTGNVLGSVVNWLLGRQADRFRNHKWFPLSSGKYAQTLQWYQRYGRWSLLLSWAPIIGDPLTVIAGILREPFWSFFILVTLAKFGRYLVLVSITMGLF